MTHNIFLGYFYSVETSYLYYVCSLNFQVNRNPIADEMKRMRQQIEYLQAELISARGGVGSDDVQVNVFDKLTLDTASILG